MTNTLINLYLGNKKAKKIIMFKDYMSMKLFNISKKITIQ